jgi:hypothetical protein
MSQKSYVDSKFFYGSPDLMSNIKKFPLVPLLSRIIPETLPLMRTWWLPWDRGQD